MDCNKKYDCFIPLGHHCNISFLCGHVGLKKESSLFEWFESPNFDDVVKVITKISLLSESDNKEVDIDKNINIIPPEKRKNNHVIIDEISIYSYHYNDATYKQILIRRCIRFIETIKKSNRILFIRIKPDHNDVTEENLNSFKIAIKRINPNLEKINLLLISHQDKKININDDVIVTDHIKDLTKGQRFENFDTNKIQIEEFANIMNNFGFETKISPYKKNDKI